MTFVEQNVQDSHPHAKHEQITTANCQRLSISGVSFVALPIPNKQSLNLSSVYLVPQLSC